MQVLPLGRSAWNRDLWLEGDPVGHDGPRRMAFWSVVRPGYFSTIGIPLRSGRDFTAHDDTAAVKVAIVMSAAVRFWSRSGQPGSIRVRR